MSKQQCLILNEIYSHRKILKILSRNHIVNLSDHHLKDTPQSHDSVGVSEVYFSLSLMLMNCYHVSHVKLLPFYALVCQPSISHDGTALVEVYSDHVSKVIVVRSYTLCTINSRVVVKNAYAYLIYGQDRVILNSTLSSALVF